MVEGSQRTDARSPVAPSVGAALAVIGLFFTVDSLTSRLVFSQTVVPAFTFLLGMSVLGLAHFRLTPLVLWTSRCVLGAVLLTCVASMFHLLPAEYSWVRSIALEWKDWFLRPDFWMALGALCLLTTDVRAFTVLGVVTILVFSVGGSVLAFFDAYPATLGGFALLAVGPLVGTLGCLTAIHMSQPNKFAQTVSWLVFVPVATSVGMGLVNDPAGRAFLLVGVLMAALCLVSWRGAIVEADSSREREDLAQQVENVSRDRIAIEEIAEVGSWRFIEHDRVIEFSPLAASLLDMDLREPLEGATFTNEFVEWIDAAVRSNESSEFVLEAQGRHVKFAGQRRYANGDGLLLGTLEDVTSSAAERKKIESEVALLRAVAEKVPDIDFIYDIRSHQYVYSNRPVGEAVGRPDSTSGTILEDAVVDEDRDALYAFVQRINRDAEPGVTSIEFRVKATEGQVRWLRLRAAVFERDEHGFPRTVFGTFQDVTEFHSVLQRLKESEDRYVRICEKSPGAIYQFAVDKEGRFHVPYISPGASDLFGIAIQELQSNAEAAFALVHEEDISGLFNKIDQSRRTLEDYSWVGRIVRNDGKTVWIQAASSPSLRDDGAVLWDGILIDVTELKEAQIALERAQKRLDALLSDAKVVLYSCESKPPHRITDVAPNIRFILGYIPDQLIGRPVFGTQFLHPDDVAVLKEHELRFADHGRSSCEFRVRSISGDYVWVRDDIRIVPANGGSVEVVGTWTEVGEIRRATDSAQESDARFLRMTSQIHGMAVELHLHSDGLPEFRFVSQGAYELVGLPPEDVKSRPELFLRMIDEESKPELYRRLIKSQLDREDIAWAGNLTRSEGPTKSVVFHARPFLSGGEVVWSGIFSEVVSAPVPEVKAATSVPEIVEAIVEAPLPQQQILVIASPEDAERLLSRGTALWDGATVSVAATAGLGLELAKRRAPDIIIIGPHLIDMRPALVIEAIREDDDLSQVPAIVFSPDANQSDRGRLLRIGASAVIEGDLTYDSLRSSVLSLAAPQQ